MDPEQLLRLDRARDQVVEDQQRDDQQQDPEQVAADELAAALEAGRRSCGPRSRSPARSARTSRAPGARERSAAGCRRRRQGRAGRRRRSAAGTGRLRTMCHSDSCSPWRTLITAPGDDARCRGRRRAARRSRARARRPRRVAICPPVRSLSISAQRLLDVVVEHVDEAQRDEDQEPGDEEDARAAAQGPPSLGDTCQILSLLRGVSAARSRDPIHGVSADRLAPQWRTVTRGCWRSTPAGR